MPTVMKKKPSSRSRNAHREQMRDVAIRDQAEAVAPDRQAGNSIAHDRAEPERAHQHDGDDADEKRQDDWREHLYSFHRASDLRKGRSGQPEGPDRPRPSFVGDRASIAYGSLSAISISPYLCAGAPTRAARKRLRPGENAPLRPALSRPSCSLLRDPAWTKVVLVFMRAIAQYRGYMRRAARCWSLFFIGAHEGSICPQSLFKSSRLGDQLPNLVQFLVLGPVGLAG